MKDSLDFEEFAANFRQDIYLKSRESGTESFEADQFTELMLEYLADAGEIDDREICSYKSRGVQVDAFSFSNENQNLDLFVSRYIGSHTPEKVYKAEMNTLFKRLKTYFYNAITHNYANIEESSPAFDLADKIYLLKNQLSAVRVFVLTDGIVDVESIDDEIYESYNISHQVWDIQRLYRMWSSGNRSEPIEIDIVSEFGKPLACLEMPEENSVFSSYLLIISGDTLSDLYGKYGPKLLERNVRAFLQMRGKVNKGIRDTIIQEPHMFLAYNNGLSATAESVEIIKKENGIPAIEYIRDFQIVNGAQTTASIHHTRSKDKRDVSGIYVPVKLTVLKNPDNIDVFVPKISEYANSQNKINAADFTSNDIYHVRIEKLSRAIWASAKKGSQQETHWFYERVRGQYQNDKNREKTPKKRRIFGDRNPSNQRFTKTDLAKYENSWEQLPYFVSLGAEKNYREYILRYRETGEFEPDVEYFHLIIAKAILFKRTDRIVNGLKFGGYKANIVTYTVAWLSKLTDKKIDLERIWKDQGLTTELEKTITDVCKIVQNTIVTPPGGKNISEWCKKKDCWESILKKKFELSEVLKSELVSEDVVNKRDIRSRQKKERDIQSDDNSIGNHLSIEEKEVEKKSIDFKKLIQNMPAQKWMKLIKDAENTNFSKERIELLRRMRTLSGRRIKPQAKEIEEVEKILMTLSEEKRID